jgi:hypothetical protein
MKSREQWIEEHELALEVYEDVEAELMGIPGVVEVGLGVKEAAGGLTDDLAFRVYVEEKLPDTDVPPERKIPPTIRGFKTDVIKVRHTAKIIGFDDENDEKNYSTKVGGISISVDGGAPGTLGCFARLTYDSSVSNVVLLTCEHVIGSAPDQGVGQPSYSDSWCCVCNEIAKTENADGLLDCAIARLKPDVVFAPKIRRIKNADGSTEESGFIKGSAEAVPSEEVWKVGAKTGLTRGTISQPTGSRIEIHPIWPFAVFADHGDSGSVVVSKLTGNVVALLNEIDKANTGLLGFAVPIGPILTKLGIKIIATDQTKEYDVSEWVEERAAIAGPATPETVFAVIADRLRMSKSGNRLLALVRRHLDEASELVNHRRPVTVAWHRNQGPTFLAAFARSARESSYRIPDAVEGVTRTEAVSRLRVVFVQHASVAFRADLERHADRLVEILATCETIDDMIAAWECEREPEEVV